MTDPISYVTKPVYMIFSDTEPPGKADHLWLDLSLDRNFVLKYWDGDEWCRMDGGGSIPDGIIIESMLHDTLMNRIRELEQRLETESTALDVVTHNYDANFAAFKERLVNLETAAGLNSTLTRATLEALGDKLMYLPDDLFDKRDGKVRIKYLPALALTNVQVVYLYSDLEAITGQDEGDVVVVIDAGDGRRGTFIWTGTDWLLISSPVDVVEEEIAAAVTAIASAFEDKYAAEINALRGRLRVVEEQLAGRDWPSK